MEWNIGYRIAEKGNQTTRAIPYHKKPAETFSVCEMPSFKVKVKWGKKKFEDLEVNTDDSPDIFKMQLYSLSGVSIERQKVMIGGVTLSNDDWGKTRPKIKENATFLMMGSAGDLPPPPEEKIKFLEDMTEAEAAAALLLPAGLDNFGNTCYMNATLQCLKVVPELKSALMSYSSPALNEAARSTHDSITIGLQLLYRMMDRGQPGLFLMMFMKALHKAMPHFAERDEKTNSFKQQDAHECWSSILSNLSQTLTFGSSQEQEVVTRQLNFMEQYFGVVYKTTYKCQDSPEEMEKVETEKSFQVSCFISQDVKYTYTGIQKGLEGTVEKISPTLNANATYKKISRVSRLPGYLTVQFVRFFVGKVGQTEEIVAKKILKDIKYSLKLDMYDFCTPELQEKLLPTRRKYKEVEDKKTAIRAKAIAEGRVHGPKKHHQSTEQKPVEYEPYDFLDDPGSNSTGHYELAAVLTHQGRSSSSGHYLGWVRHRDNEWLKLDDDKVSVVLEEDIVKLSGGGDWHTAYILLYAPMKLEKVEEEMEEESESTPAAEKMDTQQESPST